MGSSNYRHIFPHSWGGWKPQVRVQHGQAVARAHPGCLLILCSCGPFSAGTREGECAHSQITSHLGLYLITSFDFLIYLKAPSPNTVTLGVGTWTYDFGGGGWGHKSIALARLYLIHISALVLYLPSPPPTAISRDLSFLCCVANA